MIIPAFQDCRWRQRFSNFECAFKALQGLSVLSSLTKIEQAASLRVTHLIQKNYFGCLSCLYDTFQQLHLK